MPNIKSAKKRVKITEVKALQNKAFKSALRTSVKKANTAIAEGPENKAEVVKLAIQSIDRAVSKGILHKNTAARRKSQLIVKLNKA